MLIKRKDMSSHSLSPFVPIYNLLFDNLYGVVKKSGKNRSGKGKC
jgi:hypothetical protein